VATGVASHSGDGVVGRIILGLEKRLGGAVTAGQDGAPVPLRRVAAQARLVFCLFWFDTAACLASGHPLTPYLLGSALVWWWSAAHPGTVARTARSVAGQLFVGLSVVCVALVTLNTLDGAITPTTVHSFERWLARVRLAVASWTHMSLGRLLLLATVLLVLVVVALRLKPVTRFEQVHKWVGSAQAVLLVLTSFVIYVQAPLQLQVDRTHKRIVTEYRAARERQWDAQAHALGARALVQTVQSMTHSQQADLGRLVERVDGAAASTSAAAPTLGSIDTASVELVTMLGPDSVKQPSASPAPPPAVAAPPSTNQQLDGQIHSLAAQETVTTRAEAVRGQLVPWALSTTASAISLVTPIGAEPVKMVFDAWLENVAERLKGELERGRSAKVVGQDGLTLTVDESAWLLVSARYTSSSQLRNDVAQIASDQAQARVQQLELERRVQEEVRAARETLDVVP
jgi:hypothetical protein